MRIRTALKIAREEYGVPGSSECRRPLNRTVAQIREATAILVRKWRDQRFPLVEWMFLEAIA